MEVVQQLIEDADLPLRQAGQAEVPGGFQPQDEVGGDVEQPGQLSMIYTAVGADSPLSQAFTEDRVTESRLASSDWE